MVSHTELNVRGYLVPVLDSFVEEGVTEFEVDDVLDEIETRRFDASHIRDGLMYYSEYLDGASYSIEQLDEDVYRIGRIDLPATTDTYDSIP